MLKKVSQFLKEVKAEMKEVNWLNRHDWGYYTLVVISISAMVALYLWVCDLIFSNLLRLIIS